MAEPVANSAISLEFLQWSLGFCVAGYIPLASAVGVLYWELMKSKNTEAETLRSVIPIIERLIQLKESLLKLVDTHER